ncbi:hypothetical protein BRADI_2g23663v3 [Brachypodium distachyon]|uniref:DUF7597 domain-containing protein n=1 Tax=Brachypodium distachyon TaxID=15368 RepID=A0A0Q3K5E7_BRADI|nr:hypothetical protein BRADI_2g23663v3 [Brachypodium distachyon]
MEKRPAPRIGTEETAPDRRTLLDLSICEQVPRKKIIGSSAAAPLESQAKKPLHQGLDQPNDAGFVIDRRPEEELKQELWRRWRLPITVPASSRPDFFMVASFGRCKFCLTKTSMGNLLSVCILGAPEEFWVKLLLDRTFRFSLTNKNIGFHIAKLCSFSCSNFVVYFHLWGFGGPDYIRELEAWKKEDFQQWENPKKVQFPVKPKRSYAQAVANGSSFLTGANSIRIVRQFAFLGLEPMDNDAQPLPPWNSAFEGDLADAGYSEREIQLCRQRHVEKSNCTRKDTIPVSTIFERLKFPATSPAPMTEKTRFESSNGHPFNVGSISSGFNSGVNTQSNAAQADPAQAAEILVGGKDIYARPKRTCKRCLKLGHSEYRCWNAIHGRYCSKPGHIFRFCKIMQADMDSGIYSKTLGNSTKSGGFFRNFSLLISGQSSTPLQFASFTEYGKQLNIRPSDPSSSSAPPPPKSLVACALPAEQQASPSPMANFPVDPAPFVPGLFDIVEVAGNLSRGGTTSVAASRRPTKTSPSSPSTCRRTLMPLFANTRGIINHFISEHLQLRVEAIQHCPLGHAYIRLQSAADRDWLVQHSPLLHNGATFSFSKHNRGRNWHGFTYNQEVWLMLLGFHLDLSLAEHLKNVIFDWGKMVVWDRAQSNMSRIIVKVKVPDLAMIPYSLLFSHSADFQGDTWAVPIYILSSSLLGVIPPDEEDPPENGATPHPLPGLPFHQDHGHNIHHAPMIPDLNMEVENRGPCDHHVAATNVAVVANENDPEIMQWIANLPPELPNEQVAIEAMDDDSSITLTLSSNAPMAAASEGSVNGQGLGNGVEEVNGLGNAIGQDHQGIQIMDGINVNQAGQALALNNMLAGRVQIPEFNHSLEDFPLLNGPHLTKPHLEKFTSSMEGNEAWPWLGFFIAALISPDSFSWARKVLLSNMLSAKAAEVSQGFSTLQAPKTYGFLLPANASTSALRVRKSKKVPLVVTEVSRSVRLNKKAKGYKHSSYVDKHCLACFSKAPIISKKILSIHGS